MLPCSFKGLEWHKGKKHRHRRLSLLLRGLAVANQQSRELQHTLASAFEMRRSGLLLGWQLPSKVASAPLQFLPDHAEKRHIRQRRQW